MEYINEINIEEATIHVLDNNSDTPVFSEVTLKINEDLHKFLYRHLSRTVKSEDLRYGMFTSVSPVKDLSLDLFKGNLNFIDYTKAISENLFELLKIDRSINSCDLLFVKFITEFGRFIGILKMDYVKNFSHNIDVIDERLIIGIKPQISGLPSSGIRKCALIKENTLDSNYDLLFIDKPNKYESSVDYFTSDFLKCFVKNSERDLTKNFIKTIENFTKKNLAENPIESREILENAKTILTQDTVDTGDFSRNVIKDDSLRSNFISILEKEEIPQTIEIDKVWANKKLERIRLKIDNNVDIYLDADTYSNSNKFEIIKRSDGYIDIKIKSIKNYIEK